MKKILSATIVLALISCTSQKTLETTGIPFEIEQSSFQTWSGGREESGTGAELKISITEANNMSFEKVYFRGHALDCEMNMENGLSTIVASYKNDQTTDNLTDKEGKKMQEAFELKSNQAVLAFKNADGKLKYVKVEDIKEKAPVLYRGRPKN